MVLSEVEAFLASSPPEPLAGEAVAVRFELIAETRSTREAIREMDAWLAVHPGSAKAQEILFRRATLAREDLEDCALALPSYEAVAAGGGPLAVRAAQWVEYCRRTKVR